MIVICLAMYLDTMSLSVSSRFFCVLCSCCCTRFLGVVWYFENTCLSRCFVSRFNVESVQCRNESIGRHPVSRLVQRTLGEYAALSLLVSTRLETWNSRGMYMDLSRGMKVNEFADLTTSEFVSPSFLMRNPTLCGVVGSTWKLMSTSTNHSFR